MNSWNPWMELDPKAKITFSGPEAGAAAKTSWEGDGKLGTGSATVVKAILNSKVKTKLEYTKPYSMTQSAEMELETKGNQTLIRWTVSGENQFIGRFF